MARPGAQLYALAVPLLLAGCGGGGGMPIQSTPPPAVSVPAPPPASSPVTTPAGATRDFDTAEYRASSGPRVHGAIAAYEAGASGAGVLVGIVDGGLTDAAGEFTGRISPLSRDFGGNGSLLDAGGHGTAVAETLAGGRNGRHVLGIAWGAELLVLRTDRPGTCAAGGCEHSTAAMAQAVDHAWRSGARIVNISMGGDGTAPDLMSAVSRATAAETIVVVAAGNAKAGQTPSTTPSPLAASIADPAFGHGLVIIATSVDEDGTISAFSNGAAGHETRTLSALGGAVRTLDNKGAELFYTGTSFAAPQIAGAAALLAQAFPNLTSAQIVQLLLTTATDAGDPGPDAVYGMGILDVARAFQPQGQLSLAGTGAPLGLAETSLLSAAMGDARPAALGAVVLDGYARPYRTDLALGVERPGPRGRLTAALAGTQRHIQGLAGPLSLSFSFAADRPADGQGVAPTPGETERTRAQLLAGTIAARLSPRTSAAFGLRTGLETLEARLDAGPRPAFLLADAGNGTPALELRPESSAAVTHRLAPGLTLLQGVEIGMVDSTAERPGPEWRLPGRTAHYQAALAGLALARGRLTVAGKLRLVNEHGSLLGARFARALGAQSARSLFAGAELRLDMAAGLTLGGVLQQGWTHAQAGGALTEGGLLRTRAWALDLTRIGLLAPNDLAGLRIAAPLRVISSRFPLALPQSWDWQSATATIARVPLDLTPRGSERVYELSYGVGLSGGWLGANLFARTEPGNIAARRDDYGAALRWSARF